MTSICRSPIGPIISDNSTRALFFACLEESILVAKSQGILFTEKELEVLKEKSDQYKTNGPLSKASMLVDIENNRQTEIESLNGTIVKLASENNIIVPYNEFIYNAVKLSTQT